MSEFQGIKNLVPSVIGQFRAAPISTVGGSVIAMMLRNREKKGNSFVVGSNQVPTYNMAGVIPVTARLQEQYTYEAEVTQHAVEDGSLLNDHVILKPVRLDLIFEVTNIPDTAMAKKTHDMLVDMWQTRTTVDLLTEHSLLKNMLCTSIQATNEAPEWGKLEFRASFRQVTFVKFGLVKFQKTQVFPPAKNTSQPATPKSAVAPTNKGVVTPQPVRRAVKGVDGLESIRSAVFGVFAPMTEVR